MSKLRVEQLETLDQSVTVSVRDLANAKTFNSVEELLESESLEVGDYVRTLAYSEDLPYGGNTYRVVAANTGTVDNGSYLEIPSSGLQLEGLFPTGVNVQQFGSKTDDTDTSAEFSAAAAYAASKALDSGDNRGPIVTVPLARYRVEQATTPKATWLVETGAIIVGLPTVAPSYAYDMSYLTGSVIQFDGVAQYETLRVGDGSYTVQKYSNKAFSAELSGHSDNAAGGVTGSSFASGSDVQDQGCIGVTGTALQDNSTVAKSAWGGYFEVIRSPDGLGNGFPIESTIINQGNTEIDTPNAAVTSGQGLTYNLWLSSGGSSSVDATGAIGILGKAGAAYDKGIVVKKGSCSSNEAIALPQNYEMSWYGSSTSTSYENDKVAWIKANGFDGSGGVGRGQVALRVITGTGDTVGLDMTGAAFSPSVDNTYALGAPDKLYTQLYAANGSIQTSDRDYKQDISEPTEAELRVGAKLKVKRFRMKEAVSEKGDDARWHFGFIAQEVIAAFESEGLNAFDYGCVCYDEWDGGSRYGVRYDECYALMMAAK